MRLSTLYRLDAHTEGVWSTTWVPGSNQLLTGSVDESVKVWEESGETMKAAHTYTGHTLGVVSVITDPTGTYAASSALDSFVRVWNLKDRETRAVIEAPPTETWSIAFSPSREPLYLAVAGGTTNRVTIYKIGQETAEMSNLPMPQGTDEKHKKDKFVLSVAYSPDGQRLACGAMDGTVAVFDISSGSLLCSLEGHFKPVRSLCFTPDSKGLLTACDDMHVNLFDVENATLVDAFSGHESWVLSVACHPEGTCFASGSSDAKVKLWDLKTRACIQTTSDHTDQVWGVAFREDGARLASVSDDKTAVVYSVA